MCKRLHFATGNAQGAGVVQLQRAGMVTIKDVARRAGVSVATVSRVLNNSGPASPDAARRIREAAAELRYVPHGGARSLITAKSQTIGVLLPDIYGEFFSEVIRGIDQTAQLHGYHILLSGSHNGRPEIEAAMRAMRGRTDGIIAMSPHLDARTLFENLPASVPVVLLSCAERDDEHHVISIDNGQGAREMVHHLVSLGHRRIAIIQGAQGNYDATERLLGYRQALLDTGLSPDASLEVPGDFTEAAGHRGSLALLEIEDPPTAIFCANDSMAIGALSALRERGLQVPRDMTVVGFDDIPLARYMNPPLSSVHVPILEMGERAARRLIGALAGERSTAPRHERVPIRLVVRSSCGHPVKKEASRSDTK
ncbi:MAG: LacI family DNA-binding transcriptional regulator [Gemmatimonadaceae bacterium]